MNRTRSVMDRHERRHRRHLGNHWQYIRSQGHGAQLMVVDPRIRSSSNTGRPATPPCRPGRQRKLKASAAHASNRHLFPNVVDEMHAITGYGEERGHRPVAGNTAWAQGRRFYRHQYVGRIAAGRADAQEGRTGSIVTLLCDSGERYLETWLQPAVGGRQYRRYRALAGGDRRAGRQAIKPDRKLSGLPEGSLYSGIRKIRIIQPMR